MKSNTLSIVLFNILMYTAINVIKVEAQNVLMSAGYKSYKNG